VGKAKTAAHTSSARRFEKVTLFLKFSLETCLRGWLVDIKDNAVGLLVDFIIRRIAAIRA
jgi:hypothetical protein